MDLNDWKPNFEVQNAQRENMWAAVLEKLNPEGEDLMIGADLDELPRPEVIEELACREMMPRMPVCLETTDTFYYYNYKCHIVGHEWTDRPKVMRRDDAATPLGYHTTPCRGRMTNSSTHCSSCFPSLEDYVVKSVSNSEPIRRPELQTDKDSILERMRTCKDFWLREAEDAKMELRDGVEPGGVPHIVLRHPGRWPHLLGMGPLYGSIGENSTGNAANVTIIV